LQRLEERKWAFPRICDGKNLFGQINIFPKQRSVTRSRAIAIWLTFSSKHPEWEARSTLNMQSPNNIRRISFFTSSLLCISPHTVFSTAGKVSTFSHTTSHLSIQKLAEGKNLPKKVSTNKIREPDDLFLAKPLIYYYLSLKIIQLSYKKVLALLLIFIYITSTINFQTST